MGIIFLILGYLFLGAQASWAIQEHPPPEGFIAHQLAHILFAIAILVFAYRLKLTGLTKRPHWNKLRWAAYFLAFWNLFAFGGHLVTHFWGSQIFLGWQEGLHYCRRHLVIEGAKEVLYFIFKNDNLFALAAFYFLYQGLRTIERLLREGNQ